MKRICFLLATALLVTDQASAQSSFNTIEFIDINNIKAGNLVHGDMWRNTVTSGPACEYPKGSGKHLMGLGSLWMGGYDQSFNLKTAAQMYRQTGNDYFPGPADFSIAASQQQTFMQNWARIWKVNRSTIDSFRALSSHTVANTPAVFMEWPAKGNVHAKGANSAALTITADLAPFIDVDGDGTYSALKGDYPKIKGDQMLWWVINDIMSAKLNSSSGAIGVEVRNMAYAYKRNTSMDNVLFYEFSIINRGQVSLTNFRIGFNADPDLGYAFDDYIGCDTSRVRRMGYVYNSKKPDGSGGPGEYGMDIPAAGISIMEVPGDNYPNLLPLGTFNPYVNSNSLTNGNPNGAEEYYLMLNAHNQAGDQMRNDRASLSTSTGYNGTGNFTRFGFPGIPGDNTQWSQCSSGTPKTEDRRFVIATDSLTFLSGTTKRFGLALIVSPNAGACDSLNLAGLNNTADSALIVYYNQLPTGVKPIYASAKTLVVFPNPASQSLYIKPTGSVAGNVIIYDAVGRLMPVEKAVNGNTISINTTKYPAGVYTIIYQDKDQITNNVFVKQ